MSIESENILPENEINPTTIQTDPDLLAEFAEIYINYKEQIVNFLRYRLPNPADAEDLAQEVFYNALRKFPDFEDRSIPYLHYLYTIASRKAANLLRKKSTSNETPFSDQFALSARSEIGNSADLNQSSLEMEEERLWRQTWKNSLGAGNAPRELDEQFIHNEKINQLRNAISELKPDYQAIIELKYYEGLSIAEIANIVGKTESAVKATMHRAVARLKKIINPEK